jgi:hypothetical protein
MFLFLGLLMGAHGQTDIINEIGTNKYLLVTHVNELVSLPTFGNYYHIVGNGNFIHMAHYSMCSDDNIDYFASLMISINNMEYDICESKYKCVMGVNSTDTKVTKLTPYYSYDGFVKRHLYLSPRFEFIIKSANKTTCVTFDIGSCISSVEYQNFCENNFLLSHPFITAGS